MYKVFIADDEKAIIRGLKSSINWNELGFQIAGEADNGIDAYEKILEIKPDVVFTDIRMPGMNGLELIKKVSEFSQDILFVVISGYAEFAYAQKAVKYGVLGYCLKPFDEDEIAGILNKARSVLGKQISSMKMELISLIEDGSIESQQRIEKIMNAAGLELSDSKGLLAVVVIGREEPVIFNDAAYINLKIGKNTYLYLVQDFSLRNIADYMSDDMLECVKGVGVSKTYYSVESISDAIDEAFVAANQYFMTGKKGIYFYQKYDKDELRNAFFQLEDAIIKRDLNMVRNSLDNAEAVLSKGVYNIKHAFQIYNIFMHTFYTMHPEKYDNYIYDYEKLTSYFGGIHDMFEYLNGLIDDYAGINIEYQFTEVKSEIFKSILLYINENFCKDICLQAIAEKFCINSSYISQLFKKHTGETFTEYIGNLRLNYACNLLKTTALNVNEVAEKVGFNDYYYFTKVFKKMIADRPPLFGEFDLKLSFS